MLLSGSPPSKPLSSLKRATRFIISLRETLIFGSVSTPRPSCPCLLFDSDGAVPADRPERASRRSADGPSLLGVGVGIDDLAGGIGLRREDHLGLRILELLDAVALDVLELHLQHARLRP